MKIVEVNTVSGIVKKLTWNIFAFSLQGLDNLYLMELLMSFKIFILILYVLYCFPLFFNLFLARASPVYNLLCCLCILLCCICVLITLLHLFPSLSLFSYELSTAKYLVVVQIFSRCYAPLTCSSYLQNIKLIYVWWEEPQQCTSLSTPSLILWYYDQVMLFLDIL